MTQKSILSIIQSVLPEPPRQKINHALVLLTTIAKKEPVYNLISMIPMETPQALKEWAELDEKTPNSKPIEPIILYRLYAEYTCTICYPPAIDEILQMTSGVYLHKGKYILDNPKEFRTFRIRK